MNSARNIAVLMGGWSPERPVSLVSGKAASDALKRLGYNVVDIDPTQDLANQLATAFDGAPPDVVFNGLHGEGGEDGIVQGVLETMRLPYTHSGVLSSALAMDKEKAKTVMRAAGLPVPDGRLWQYAEMGDRPLMDVDHVIKPNTGGSSFGVEIIKQGDNRSPRQLLSAYENTGDEFVVEQFIKGRELTTAVMGDRALAVTEIIAHAEFYNYDAKYAAGGSSHIVPAEIPARLEQRCLELALAAHQALACRGLTRTDFRYDETDPKGGLYILEVNTQPGLTPTSLAPEQAAHLGISFDALIDWMIGDASCDR